MNAAIAVLIVVAFAFLFREINSIKTSIKNIENQINKGAKNEKNISPDHNQKTE